MPNATVAGSRPLEGQTFRSHSVSNRRRDPCGFFPKLGGEYPIRPDEALKAGLAH